VKRNAARFPEDFMFRLTKEEAEAVPFSTFRDPISELSLSPDSRKIAP
jgi:hypothetical protein